MSAMRWATRVTSTIPMLVSMAMFGATASNLNAATLVVTTTNDMVAGECTVASCSLRDAVLTANASGAPTRIVLGEGTYRMSIIGVLENEGLTGDFDVTGDVTIVGAGANATTIAAQLGEQAIDVARGARLRLEGLSVSLGVMSGTFGNGDRDQTSLEVVNSVISPSAGPIVGTGSVSVQGGSALIQNSVVNGWYFSPNQAAILFTGKRLTVIRSTINGGSRVIYVPVVLSLDSEVEFIESTFAGSYMVSSNTDDCLYARIAGEAKITIDRSEFVGITATRAHGGACIFGDRVRIRGSSFARSPLSFPDVLIVGGTDVEISDSTVNGGVVVGGGVVLKRTTIVSSNEPKDSYWHALRADVFGSVTLINSVIVGHCDGIDIQALGNNVESPGSTCGLPPATNLSNQAVSSLALGPLAYNDGTTLSYLPSPTSVLNTYLTVDGRAYCEGADQRGYLRSASCTIGAVDVSPVDRIIHRSGFEFSISSTP